MSAGCVDQVVGDILATWRYDISGITPEMRSDYEQHFQECAHCRGRQRLHRIIDVSLIAIATVSAAAFLAAFGIIRYFDPRHAHLLEFGALCGFAFSTVMWTLVAVATPAPIFIQDVALQGARRLRERLPEQIRERIPEKITEKLNEKLGEKASPDDRRPAPYIAPEL
jgi:hypothetical protein